MAVLNLGWRQWDSQASWNLAFVLFPVGLESVAGEAVWECLLFASLAVFKL